MNKSTDGIFLYTKQSMIESEFSIFVFIEVLWWKWTVVDSW